MRKLFGLLLALSCPLVLTGCENNPQKKAAEKQYSHEKQEIKADAKLEEQVIDDQAKADRAAIKEEENAELDQAKAKELMEKADADERDDRAR